MKHKLLPLETNAGTGRVRLSDFNNASDLFIENVSDLRDMAALDETDPTDPMVLIPNYLQGGTNCITPAGYYSICCFDECEALMDKIESHFEAPAAYPEAIASFVASLPSSSTQANRSLAPDLLWILGLLAMNSGGMVPLHGKEFAEWMHQAYPRECSHPQQSKQDRFDLNFRRFMDEMKAEHATTTDIALSAPAEQEKHQKLEDRSSEQGQSEAASYELFMTFVLGFVGMALAKVVCNIRKGNRVKWKEV